MCQVVEYIIIVCGLWRTVTASLQLELGPSPVSPLGVVSDGVGSLHPRQNGYFQKFDISREKEGREGR